MDPSSASLPSQFLHDLLALWHYRSVFSRKPQPSHDSQPSHLVGPASPPHPRQNPEVESSPSTTDDSTNFLHPLFRLMDQNNDGEVTLEEMMCLLRKLGKELSQTCLISLLKPLDHNDDMSLNFREFAALYASICATELETDARDPATDGEVDSQDLLDTFQVYDKNRDGYISAAELSEVLRDLGLREGMDLVKCQTLIDRVDKDGNGLVDLNEFKAMLSRGCEISYSSRTTQRIAVNCH